MKRLTAVTRHRWAAVAASLALEVLAGPTAMAFSSSAQAATSPVPAASAPLGSGVQPTTVGGASPSGANWVAAGLSVTVR
ncbi:MAG TPA: hypothetical protein VHZ33_00315 [Trebonia sp.]|nr:hypothetical protein [Trebonia sp.]